MRVCLNMKNFNGDSHAMHLHGHSYRTPRANVALHLFIILGSEVVEIEGVPISGAFRDTVLMPKGDCREVKICFDADNPGVWPFHCQ